MISRLKSDLRVIAALVRGMPRNGDHAQRLEGFYAQQADDYDRFRERLLPGRAELYADLALQPGQILVELGGGTAAGLRHLGATVHELAAVHVVDLCPSLLAQAQQRCHDQEWSTVHCHQGDATQWQPPQPADAVVLSYALTMMPTWPEVLANALRMLKPGGLLGVVDFHLSAPYPRPGRAYHWALRRWFWRRWFAHDGVHLGHERMDAVLAATEAVILVEDEVRMPWLPVRVPYCRYVGRGGVAAS